MTPNTEDRVIALIGKLLSMADPKSGASETEMTLAAEKATALLQEHNLTLARIEAGGTKADSGTREKRSTARHAMYAWERSLMEHVAELNFCINFIVKEKDPTKAAKWQHQMCPRHHLVGRKINVDITIQMFDYLVAAMRRLAQDAGFSGAPSQKGFHVWMEGCSSRLTERLREKLRVRLAEDEARKNAGPAPNGSHKELVLSDVYGDEKDQNNDVRNGYPPGTTSARRREANERYMRQRAEHDRLVAEGVNDTVAWYQAYGYGADRATELAAGFIRRSSRRARRTKDWSAANERYYQKVNSAEYKAGRAAGDTIGLDEQVGSASAPKIGR